MKTRKPHNLTLKPRFTERMQKLLPNKSDYQSYLDILKILPAKSIRCNKLKISPSKLKQKLEAKGWKIKQPWKDHPEVMVVENDLEPGELGRALEHLLGYYYIQELASMLPIIALKPEPKEMILDLCSAPGSKTTQTASEMENTGTIIANEVSMGRLKILASNLERCGVTNTIITKRDGIALCNKLKKQGIMFDRILVDAPCSGEGTLRSSPKTYLMWNPKTIKTLSRLQIRLVESAIDILKPNGTLIYSTCTHAPEENEGVVDNILNKFEGEVKLEKVKLPIKHREGLTKWKDKKYSKELKKCARVYPQDANTEGFFVAKFRREE
ncbi:RsmB/NOP family class I SAM-dependent RNA methyltransferase [Candidatus Pacearchaeota archaeon]|nr:RsmB/NOP family class I SAM-dependent RNA methyltransferase [Candidatus Pacearchaeota archaeon]